MTEEDILVAICGGGSAAQKGVRALYERTAKPMLRFFVHCGGISAEDAEDVYQETAVKIVGSAASYSGDGTAKAWMWQIARNSLTDHLRKRGRVAEHLVIFDDDDWRILEDTVAAPESGSPRSAEECVTAGVAAFAQEMPDRAFVLTLYMDGMSMDEIGEQIGRTAGATQEYLSQTRQKLKPFVAHCLELLGD
jgi:RNA polymerase sigma-70 factor (ECF subfamily)